MRPSSRPRSTLLLRALALAQAIAIAALAVLVLQRGDEIAPVAASPQAPDAAGAASAPVSSATATNAPAAADAVAAAPTATPAKSLAGTGTVLYGRITNAAGAVPQAYVSFSRAGESIPFANVQSGENNPCFAIAGVAPGEVTFQARASGYKNVRGTIVIPAATPHLRHDILLQDAWQLAVNILTPDGAPLSDAITAASKAHPGLFQVEVAAVATAARPDGDFAPTGLREIRFGLGRWQSDYSRGTSDDKQPPKVFTGVIEMDVKRPVWVSAVMRHRVLTSIAVEAGQSEVTLTIALEQVLRDLGTIRGRIVDAATGKPLQGARVGFGDQQSGGIGKVVDNDGRFEATCLRPGLLTMEVYAATVSMRPLVRLQPGQALDLGDVPVAAVRTIKGRCEGVTSRVEGFTITSLPLDPPAHPALRHDTGYAQVATDGSFTLHLTEGRYRVRASGAGGAVVDIDTKTLGEVPLVLHLAKEAPLRIEVQDDDPPELTLFDSNNREVWRGDLGSGWKFTLMLLQGDYRAELRNARGQVETRQLALGEAGAELRLP